MHKETISINLRDYQTNGESHWDLPPWNHPIAQGVYPLFIRVDQHLFPVGTATCISSLGFLASATHCFLEGLKHEPRGREKHGPGNHDLSVAGFTVLSHRAVGAHESQFVLWPVEHATGGLPSDTIFGTLVVSPETPLLSFGVSPAIPRHHSRVLIVGYHEFKYPLGGIPIARVRSRTFDWATEYSHTLSVSEGTVEALFPTGFMKGYAEGPSFKTSARTWHGQSGGPVLNEAGFVCGIQSTGLEVFGMNGGLASMIYPLLAVELPLTLRFGPNATMQVRHPLLSLLHYGQIRSDGSEQHANVSVDTNGIRIDPWVHKDDVAHVFDNIHAFRSGISSNPILSSD